MVPAVEIDGVVTSIMHPAQLATLLDLPTPPGLDSTRVGYDMLTVVDSWVENLRPLSWEVLNLVTRSRTRTVRVLAFNALDAVAVMAKTWDTGSFPKNSSEHDEEESALLDTHEKLIAWTESVRDEWAAFMLGAEETLAVSDPPVATQRGPMPYSELLSHIRWTTAFHHRQLVEFLEGEGIEPPHGFRVESLTDVTLPESVFET